MGWSFSSEFQGDVRLYGEVKHEKMVNQTASYYDLLSTEAYLAVDLPESFKIGKMNLRRRIT